MKQEHINQGIEWYNRHKDYVDKLIELADKRRPFEPCAEDRPYPGLWKEGSWYWFATEGHIMYGQPTKKASCLKCIYGDRNFWGYVECCKFNQKIDTEKTVNTAIREKHAVQFNKNGDCNYFEKRKWWKR